mgnify:CR=1 FL=1
MWKSLLPKFGSFPLLQCVKQARHTIFRSRRNWRNNEASCRLTTASQHNHTDKKLLHARTLTNMYSMYYVHCKKSLSGYWLGRSSFLFGPFFVEKTNFVFFTKIEPNAKSVLFLDILYVCLKRWLKWSEFNYLNRFLVEKAWDIFFLNSEQLITCEIFLVFNSTWNSLTHLDNQILPKSCIDIKNLSFTIFTLSAFGSLTSTKISQK